ncbi:MAG: Rrf2 family transcriptional regulator [Proteobacteria bacterium]|jgi:Rrf2 family nitric oxide-sensitive transcriptional repressor|nr:Rrf2 family transcriptional regulator [Pseudomonadota bacterium]
MRLTTFSDYSLRVLMYLGVHRGRLATIGEVARAYAVSENHLVKVVHHLARHGYVETLRGKGGGMRLARAPEAINVGEVVRGTEENLVLVECFDSETSNCRIGAACLLKGILARAVDAFFVALDDYTLADLLVTGPRLAAMLVLPDARPGRSAAQPAKSRH